MEKQDQVYLARFLHAIDNDNPYRESNAEAAFPRQSLCYGFLTFVHYAEIAIAYLSIYLHWFNISKKHLSRFL